MIPTVTVSADKNPDYSTNPGNTTQDQVFLLSITEANKYLSSYSARHCTPTEYAVAGGAYVYSTNGNCGWWVRSPGYNQNYAANVYNFGSSLGYDNYVVNDNYAVRPALWIDLNSQLFKSEIIHSAPRAQSACEARKSKYRRKAVARNLKIKNYELRGQRDKVQ